MPKELPIIVLIIAIILKNLPIILLHILIMPLDLEIFLLRDKSDGMGLRSSRKHGLHGPEKSREVCSKAELLLSLLVPPSERDRRDVSGVGLWTSSHCITDNSPRVTRMIVLIIAHHHAHHYRYLNLFTGKMLTY